MRSYLLLNIITSCEQNDIAFIFLPTNSTHICQPLDVSIFGSLKRAWRKVFTEWKYKNKGVLAKSEFPTLLKKMLNLLQPTLETNIKAGFASTGIISLNCNKVLKKLDKCYTKNVEEAAMKGSFSAIME